MINSLPNKLLFSGPKGIGKNSYGNNFFIGSGIVFDIAEDLNLLLSYTTPLGPGNNYFFIYNEGGKDESSGNNAEILMSLNPIFELYKSNEIAAWDKYNGIVYQIVGKVNKIDSGTSTIIVKSNQYFVNCNYTPRDYLNIVALELNGPISVKGPLKLSKGRDRKLYLSINNCRVLGRNQYKTKEDITNDEIYKKDQLKKSNEEKRVTDIINSEYF